jgi:hypothetical protein
MFDWLATIWRKIGAVGDSPSYVSTAIRTTKCSLCARTNTGRIKRNAIAKRLFEHSHPCPSAGRASEDAPGMWLLTFPLKNSNSGSHAETLVLPVLRITQSDHRKFSTSIRFILVLPSCG